MVVEIKIDVEKALEKIREHIESDEFEKVLDSTIDRVAKELAEGEKPDVLRNCVRCQTLFLPSASNNNEGYCAQCYRILKPNQM